MSITYRSVKGSKLTSDEVDGNFLFLENQVAGGNRFTSFTGFSLAGQNLTLNAGSNWVINTVGYVNASPVVINIPFAASGMERIDLIVANASNTFVRVAGVESASNPVAPALPANTVQATFVSVTDGSVGSGGTPIVGNEYVEKIEFIENPITDNGDLVLLLDTESTAYRLTGSVTSLIGFDATLLFDSANAYVGKEIKVVNNTGEAFPIIHNDGTVNYPIRFPSEVDFVLNDKEVLVFKIVKTDVVNCEFVSVSRDVFGSGLSNTDSLPEGSTNLYHTSARVLATVLSGLSLATGGAIVSTDTVLQAFGKLQKQINDLTSVFVPLTRTLTINGTTADLSADRTFIVLSLLEKYPAKYWHKSNGVSINDYGDNTLTSTGTATFETISGGGLSYSVRTTAATAGTSCALYQASFGRKRADKGGHYVKEFFFNANGSTAFRCFSGIGQVGVIGNINPSVAGASLYGLTADSGDTEYHFIYKVGVAAATRITLTGWAKTGKKYFTEILEHVKGSTETIVTIINHTDSLTYTAVLPFVFEGSQKIEVNNGTDNIAVSFGLAVDELNTEL